MFHRPELPFGGLVTDPGKHTVSPERIWQGTIIDHFGLV
jgi:hypothetical protein